MVLFFKSDSIPGEVPVILYMGRDKVESESPQPRLFVVVVVLELTKFTFDMDR